jgi:hypothetical protein
MNTYVVTPSVFDGYSPEFRIEATHFHVDDNGYVNFYRPNNNLGFAPSAVFFRPDCVVEVPSAPEKGE